jgi:hypothetical protein
MFDKKEENRLQENVISPRQSYPHTVTMYELFD